MSIQDDDMLTPEEEFSNAAMRRALQHAPDHAAAPDWRIRRAIQQRAREALAPPTVEEELGVPWWKRLWVATGSRGSGNRMPWNAAFATVALAVLVTLLWQREPVPGAKLDGEAQVTAPAAPPPAMPEPAPVPAPAPAPAKAPEAAAESRPQGKATAPAPPVAERAPEPSSVPAPTPPAPPAADRAARDSARAEAPAASNRSAIAERESKKLEADDEVPPPASAPKAAREAPPAAPAAAPATAPPAQAAPAAVSPPAADRRSRANAAPAEALPAAPPPPAAQGSVGASAAPAAPAAVARAPAAPTERTDATEPPTFAALSQWNRLAITRSGGATRSVTRAEAGELAPLMGSAAISAVEPRRLAGRVEWRISLERDGKVLAVLELAQGQVRWREGSTPSATGVPPAGALDALRRALGELMAPPPAPPPLEPAAEPSR